MQHLPIDVGDGIAEWARRRPAICEVWLFGSRAKGTQRPDSDIDLAVRLDGWDDPFGEAFGENYGDWIFTEEAALAELVALTPLPFHVQVSDIDDIIVGPAIWDHGVLLYRRP